MNVTPMLTLMQRDTNLNKKCPQRRSPFVMHLENLRGPETCSERRGAQSVLTGTSQACPTRTLSCQSRPQVWANRRRKSSLVFMKRNQLIINCCDKMISQWGKLLFRGCFNQSGRVISVREWLWHLFRSDNEAALLPPQASGEQSDQCDRERSFSGP